MAQETEFKIGYLLVPGEIASPLPLRRTVVTGQIVGPVASLTVTQHFDNPFPQPVDLEYLFPLPHEAAVVDYRITIGERTIAAEIKESQVAREKYLEAISEGRRASLLEQRRPNLFSIQIGNVQPGETIITALHYDERLSYRDGEYEFVFPMGLTPRYHRPGMSLDEMRGLTAPVTPDESEVGPVEINLSLLPGLPITPPVSRTHPITLTPRGQDFELGLAARTIPDQDFVLRYQVAADLVRTAAWTSHDGDLDTALITLLPPRFDGSLMPVPREFIFVIDRSGSMQGKPIEQDKNALRACIRALNDADTFTIQAFDTEIEWFDRKMVSVTQEHVDAADRWLDQIDGRGGTEIVSAIEAALKLSADPGRGRFVVFLTDGAVSAEDEALRQINRHRGDARIFSFGIGPSVNRYLLAKLAQLGRGTAEFLGLDDDIEAAITRFQDRVSYPVLQDLRLDWRGADTWDTYPDVLPDLYVGEPLQIVTRLKRAAGPTSVRLIGTLSGRRVEMALDLPPAVESRPAVQRLWARARIDALLGQSPESIERAREQIIALALEHRLMTAYTSFVAVDSAVTARQGDHAHVKVAVPLPEGLDFEGFAEPRIPPRVFGLAMPTGSPSSGLRFTANRAMSSADLDLPAFMRRRTASGAPPAAAHFAPPRAPEPVSAELHTVEDRLKWLARTQKVDGSWDNAEMTAAALLAFVRAGHTTRAGNYRRQVDKAARWLRDNFDSLRGFDRFVAVRALDELHAASGDYAIADEWRAGLSVPKTDVERAARGFSPDHVPDQVTSLDDLRIVALLRGEVATITLPKEPRGPLVQTWLAVSKAPQP